jgi:hypothetical protein
VCIEPSPFVIAKRNSHHIGADRRASRAVAAAEAARPRRLVSARIHVERIVLRAEPRRAGRGAQAAERDLPLRLDIERELLFAQRRHPALSASLTKWRANV